MSLKQKTFMSLDTDKLDEKVNSFGEKHTVRASQSYFANALNVHVRVLFYEQLLLVGRNMKYKIGFEESSKAITAHVYVEGEQGAEDLKKAKELFKDAQAWAHAQTQLKLMRGYKNERNNN